MQGLLWAQVLEIVNDKEVWLLREGAQPVPYTKPPGRAEQDLRAERNARWAWLKSAVDPRMA